MEEELKKNEAENTTTATQPPSLERPETASDDPYTQHQPIAAEPSPQIESLTAQQPVVSAPEPAAATPVFAGGSVNSVSQTDSVLSPANGGSKKKKLAILALVAVILLSGGAFAALAYVNNKPEKVLADALTNTVTDVLEKKPVTTLGSAVFEAKGEQNVKVTVKFDGRSTGQDAAGSADITVNFAGKDFNVKARTAVFGEKELYFKIENLKKTVDDVTKIQPVIGEYAKMASGIINKLDNKWVKVTEDDLKKNVGVDPETVDKCAESLKTLKLSKADQKKFKKLFKENQFIIASEKLKAEKASDEDSFHYKIDFNDKAAEGFAKQVIELESFKAAAKDCELTAKKIEDGFKDSSSSSSNKESQVKPVVELWVGKSSRRPTKFKVAANDKDLTIDFTSEVKLNAQNVKVEKPSDSISISEVIAEFEKLSTNTNQNTSTFSNL